MTNQEKKFKCSKNYFDLKNLNRQNLQGKHEIPSDRTNFDTSSQLEQLCIFEKF